MCIHFSGKGGSTGIGVFQTVVAARFSVSSVASAFPGWVAHLVRAYSLYAKVVGWILVKAHGGVCQ